MANKNSIPIRLSEEIIERLDKLAKAMEKRTGGAKVSRSEVMRLAISRGTEALEEFVAKGRK